MFRQWHKGRSSWMQGIIPWTPSTVSFSASGNLTIRVPAIAASGTEVFTATGAEAFTVSALSATGSFIFQGTGSITLRVPAIAATGIETFTATASVTLPVSAISGTGAEVFSGSATISISVPSIATSGEELFDGTATVAFTVPAISGSEGAAFTGSAAIAIQTCSLAASGEELFEGTTALSIAVPTIDGVASEVFQGTATIAFDMPAISGSDSATFTGSGNVAFGKPALAGGGIVYHVQPAGGGSPYRVYEPPRQPRRPAVIATAQLQLPQLLVDGRLEVLKPHPQYTRRRARIIAEDLVIIYFGAEFLINRKLVTFALEQGEAGMKRLVNREYHGTGYGEVILPENFRQTIELNDDGVLVRRKVWTWQGTGPTRKGAALGEERQLSQTRCERKLRGERSLLWHEN